MKFGKRQLILAALVVALGAAVYINWQFSGSENFVATNNTVATSSKTLGEATYVNNSVNSEISSENQNTTSSAESNTTTSSETTSSQQGDYFAQAILNRQKSRDEAKDTLQEIIESAKSTDEAKLKATEQVAEIAQNIERESNIENIIKAKNYPNCIAFIQNGECSVVVSCPDGFLESDAVIIKDVISGQGNIPANKIKIIEAT